MRRGTPLDETSTKLSDLLPRCLDELVIHRVDVEEDSDPRHDYRQLDHLVRNRLSSLPNLKRVRYVCGKNPFPYDEDCIPASHATPTAMVMALRLSSHLKKTGGVNIGLDMMMSACGNRSTQSR